MGHSNSLLQLNVRIFCWIFFFLRTIVYRTLWCEKLWIFVILVNIKSEFSGGHINSFRASGDFCLLLIIFAS